MQVNGRHELSWERRSDLDVWYVDHASVCLDCRIPALTARKALRMEGIYQQGEATAPRFTHATPVSVWDRG